LWHCIAAAYRSVAPAGPNRSQILRARTACLTGGCLDIAPARRPGPPPVTTHNGALPSINLVSAERSIDAAIFSMSAVKPTPEIT